MLKVTFTVKIIFYEKVVIDIQLMNFFVLIKNFNSCNIYIFVNIANPIFSKFMV